MNMHKAVAQKNRTVTGALRPLGKSILLLVLAVSVGSAWAYRISDIKNTKHNFTVTGPGDVKFNSDVPVEWRQREICVFCHTPHGTTTGVEPLWNRRLSQATYTTYSSSSLDYQAISGVLAQPGGSSKLCLSCHDGTLAIGNVNVMWGRGSTEFLSTWMMPMSGVEGNNASGVGGVMPSAASNVLAVMSAASAVLSGYTRNLSIDLTNDHPISVTYDHAVAARDGELRDLDNSQKSLAVTNYAAGVIVGVRSSGYRPMMQLEPTGPSGKGQVQCGTCHDPHMRDTDEATLGNQKFLRINRFQDLSPMAGVQYDAVHDIGCLACHDKNFKSTVSVTQSGAGTWIYSAHANDQVATHTYSAQASAMNEFPASLPVWKASCLNCHDTHTVQGSRWLLREGTDSISTPKSGGKSAIEETCFQCHTTSTSSALDPTSPAQDIKFDYTNTKHMPITLAEQGGAASEVHDVGGTFNDGGAADCTLASSKPYCGADGVESQLKLGSGDLNNRHAECTDCHNPHRTIKFNSFAPSSLSAPPDATGTHKHVNQDLIADSTMKHTNIASGALRGTFGVEPSGYVSNSFLDMPSGYNVKRGDPGTDVLPNATYTNCAGATNKAYCDGKTYVTREYQICLKCHSDYGYSDSNIAPYMDLPPLGGTNLTAAGTNNMSYYTNQAREFQAPTASMGDVSGVTTTGAAAAYLGVTQFNYRSWHPVMDQTGRTEAIRGIVASAVMALPWSNDVGNQTMYCSDCHGADVTAVSSVIPDNIDATRATWGPHGSTNNFLLKGGWGNAVDSAQQSTGLCFKCHDYDAYATSSVKVTGFFLGGEPASSPAFNMDGHAYHAGKIGAMRCSWCHVAVPHGWKNKGLLVNLNDVGAEAGTLYAPTSEVQPNTTAAFDQGPYYLKARLKVRTFARSGMWKAADCGSSGANGNGAVGLAWMSASSVTPSENCATPP